MFSSFTSAVTMASSFFFPSSIFSVPPLKKLWTSPPFRPFFPFFGRICERMPLALYWIIS
nr:MAG TPA: hypothetical protein [Bacteriophage sp.]